MKLSLDGLVSAKNRRKSTRDFDGVKMMRNLSDHFALHCFESKHSPLDPLDVCFRTHPGPLHPLSTGPAPVDAQLTSYKHFHQSANPPLKLPLGML